MSIRMEAFRRVEALVDDFNMTVLCFNTAHREMKEITAAVKNRIEAEKARNVERLKELRDTMADSSRTGTVRRMAAAEIEKIEAYTPVALQAEAEAFEQAKEECNNALQDLQRIKAGLAVAFADVAKEMQNTRSETLGKVDVDLWGNWVLSAEKGFERVTK